MRILMHMTTKNVYVADTDMELFEEAAAFAGGMSPAVVAGLRLYVAQQRRTRKEHEMHQIEVEVQDGQVLTTKRFTGRMLLRYEQPDGIRVTTFRVYLTARGQLAVYSRNAPDWARTAASGMDADDADPAAWSGDWWATGERTLRVYADTEAAAAALPAGLVEAIRRALSEPAIEELDI